MKTKWVWTKREHKLVLQRRFHVFLFFSWAGAFSTFEAEGCHHQWWSSSTARTLCPKYDYITRVERWHSHDYWQFTRIKFNTVSKCYAYSPKSVVWTCCNQSAVSIEIYCGHSLRMGLVIETKTCIDTWKSGFTVGKTSMRLHESF